MAFKEEGLLRTIEQCKKNIGIFEEAIEKERKTMKEAYDAIEHNKKQQLIEQEKRDNVHIEIVRE